MCIFDFLSLLCSSTLISPLFSAAGRTRFPRTESIQFHLTLLYYHPTSCWLHISASTITVRKEEGEEGKSKGRREYKREVKLWIEIETRRERDGKRGRGLTRLNESRNEDCEEKGKYGRKKGDWWNLMKGAKTGGNQPAQAWWKERGKAVQMAERTEGM